MLYANPRKPGGVSDFFNVEALRESNNQKLLDYQNDYLDNGNLESWGALWLLSFETCKNIIRGHIKRLGFWLSEGYTVEDKAMEAVIYVLRRYKTRPGYRIEKNFISALKFSVQHALFYQTMESRVYDAAWRFGDPRMKQVSNEMVLDYIPRFEDTIHR